MSNRQFTTIRQAASSATRVTEATPEQAASQLLPTLARRDQSFDARAPMPPHHVTALHQASGGRLARAGDALLQLQQRYGNRYVQQIVAQTRQTKPTGLPDALKMGIEQLAGFPLDQVRVHYNSAKPARLNALAYTQGSEIHVGPGQERHLPHEAWHVVQQMRGQVQPTIQMAGALLNDESALEQEAAQMGASALRLEQSLQSSNKPSMATTASTAQHALPSAAPASNQPPIQRVIKIGKKESGVCDSKGGKNTIRLIEKLSKSPEAENWKKGWKKYVKELAGEKTVHSYVSRAGLITELDGRFEKPTTDKIDRPSFGKPVYDLAKSVYSVAKDEDMLDIGLKDEDLAVPHRFPYSDIRDNVLKFTSGKETSGDLERWTGRLLDATKKRKEITLQADDNDLLPSDYGKKVDRQIKEFSSARKALIAAKPKKKALSDTDPSVIKFIGVLNSLHGNVPDLGPHSSVNVRVSDRGHPHFLTDGSASPGTEAMLTMSPPRFKKGLAYDSTGEYLITTDGYRVDPDELPKGTRGLVKQQTVSSTKIDDELDEYGSFIIKKKKKKKKKDE